MAVIAAAIIVASGALWFAPSRKAPSAGGVVLALPEACRVRPTIDCLADAAFEMRSVSPKRGHSGVATNLARVGHFEQARIVADMETNEVLHRLTHATIVQCEVAAAARADPDSAELAALDKVERPTSAYFLTALDLLGRRPYDAPDFDIGRMALRQLSTTRTVTALIERLRAASDAVGPNLRPSTYAQLAELLILTGDVETAKQYLQYAVEGQLTRTQVASLWVRAGDPNRAIEIADEFGGVGATVVLDAVRAKLQRNDPVSEAVAALKAAYRRASDARPERDDDERRLVQLLATIDRAAAAEAAGDAYARAKEPRVFPWAPYLKSAAMFADVGDLAAAREAIGAAIATFPRDSTIVAVGFHFGPMRFADWDLKNEALMSAAVQFFRIGDTESAAALLKELPDRWRADMWMKLLTEALPPGVSLPTWDAMVVDLPDQHRARLLSRIAAIRAGRGEFGGALDAVRQMLDDPKLAVASATAAPTGLEVSLLANDRPLAIRALRAMIEAASRGDPETYGLRLSHIAALWAELLPEVEL